MNPEMKRLFQELEPYMIEDEEHCCYVLKKDAPPEIKEKYNICQNMEDDLIFVEDINDFISDK